MILREIDKIPMEAMLGQLLNDFLYSDLRYAEIQDYKEEFVNAHACVSNLRAALMRLGYFDKIGVVWYGDKIYLKKTGVED